MWRLLYTNAEKNFILFNFSGICYVFIEMMWRGYSHYTMFFTGGLCFLTLCKVYCKHKNLSFFQKYLIGALVITLIEFLVGCIVNLLFDMNVWNYSKLPFNILGQVSLIYSLLWGFLGVFVDSIVNHKVSCQKRSHSS